jgi:hypothetical protein
MTMTKFKLKPVVSDGTYPDETQIADELLAVWDSYSPLALSALKVAYQNKLTLDDVGIDPEEARACVNKYNALVFRGPGVGPLVTPSQAKAWVSKEMPSVVAELAKRCAAPTQSKKKA